MSVHTVIGRGPLGLHTARRLVEMGHTVRLVSRTAEEAGAQIAEVQADARSTDALAEVLSESESVYHCANAPYHRWAEELPGLWSSILEATGRVGARLVVGTNLYAHGKPNGPLTASSPVAPCTKNGRVRAHVEALVMNAHERGEITAALVRASDFYGPLVRDSALGDRFFGALADGKPPTLFGRRKVPHSYAYIEDFAAAMASVGTDGRAETWGRSWIAPHAPAATPEEIEAIVREPAGVNTTKVMGRGMVRLGGLFVRAAREMVEMFYQFDRPFVVDARETSRRFSLEPTPLRTGLAATLEWHRGAEEATGRGSGRAA